MRKRQGIVGRGEIGLFSSFFSLPWDWMVEKITLLLLACNFFKNKSNSFLFSPL